MSGKHQHYIPKFYQRGWSENNLVFVFNKEFNKILKGAKSIKNLCVKDYVYEYNMSKPTFLLDKANTNYESKLSVLYKNTVKSFNSCIKVQFSDKDKEIICRTCSHLMARNPENLKYNCFTDYIITHFSFKIPESTAENKYLCTNALTMIPGGILDEDIFNTLINSKLSIYHFDKSKVVYAESMLINFNTEILYFPLDKNNLAIFEMKNQLNNISEKYQKERKIYRNTNNYENILALYKNYPLIDKIYANNKETLQYFIK